MTPNEHIAADRRLVAAIADARRHVGDLADQRSRNAADLVALIGATATAHALEITRARIYAIIAHVNKEDP